jgi:hypothetical protein
VSADQVGVLSSGDDRAGPVATGIVVDRSGAPVAGARVVAQFVHIRADSTQVGIQLDVLPYLRTTVSNPDGTFSLGVFPPVVRAAQAGELRSRATTAREAGTRLVVEPTRALSGRVTGVDAAKLRWPLVVAHAADDGGLEVFAPLAADGSFAIAGLPDRAVDIAVTDGVDHPTSSFVRVDRTGNLRDLVVAVGFGTRTLELTTKSTSVAPVQSAIVYIVESGGTPPRQLDDVSRRHRFAEEWGTADPDHAVVTHFVQLPPGPVMACANADFGDPQANSDTLEVGCTEVAAGATSAVLAIDPPTKK